MFQMAQAPIVGYKQVKSQQQAFRQGELVRLSIVALSRDAVDPPFVLVRGKKASI